MIDPFDSQEWLDFADSALNELVPKLQDSAVAISLVPDGPGDVKYAVELGFCIMMDKPIIAVVTRGAKVPAKIVAVADAIVEGNFDDPKFREHLQAEIARVIGEHDG